MSAERPPESDGSGYFLYHSIGMFPDKGRRIGEALAAFAARWATPDDGQWEAALGARQEFIDRWRILINARRGTLTNAENVTSALYTLVNSLPGRYRAQRRILIAADCFPSLHFLLAGMAARHGFVLDTVPLRAGETWVREEDLIAHWTADVGIALLTSVTSTASYRCDLAALIAHGRRMGSLIGVDITQSVGLFPFDVQATGVDFVVSTSLKWLGGTPGAGILYVRAPLIGACEPELRGWFSQQNIFSWDLDGFAYAPDAHRFDSGTPSVLACVGTLPALLWHAAQDGKALLAHNRTLAAALIEGAAELGLPITSPLDERRRGGSTMIRLPPGTHGRVLSALRDAGLYADSRGTTLRLSPGNMTSAGGVERLIRVLSRSIQ
ncbi:MAG TPA: aminotransferase class V-fold PLP-dependent enzyme [Steroidobacteraceae bacterium]|nr:aminotransferase class V-fold PLP-dependent enzyme [Steroidobacteraceae bacterium]